MSHQRYSVFKATINEGPYIRTDCWLTSPRTWSLKYKKKKIKARALWDTGATHSVIDHRFVPRLASSLGVRSHNKAKATTVVGKSVIADLYWVRIGLPNNISELAEVSALDLGPDDVLIGMDIIAKGDMAICGGKLFSFCSPSLPQPPSVARIGSTAAP